MPDYFCQKGPKQGSAATFGRTPFLGSSVFAGVHEMMKLDDRRVFTLQSSERLIWGEKGKRNEASGP